jgi:hypothetical protein
MFDTAFRTAVRAMEDGSTVGAADGLCRVGSVRERVDLELG